MTESEWTWNRVRRLLSDLESDGYEPRDLATSTSRASPNKILRLEVERDD